MIFIVLVEYNCLPRHWVIPETIQTPAMEGLLENLTGGGGGVNGSGNSDVRGALNLKIHPQG